MKKVLTGLFAAVLATSGVACSPGGPSDEFCDAALEWVALLDDNLGLGAAPTSTGYAELEAGVAELNTVLQKMSDSTEDDGVKENITVVQESFEEFAATGDEATVASEDTRAAVDGIEAYAADCEGFEEAAKEAGAVEDTGTEGEEVDEGLEALQSLVINLATAEESYLTGNGTYTDSVEDLEGEGVEVPEGYTVEITADGGRSYCVEASDDSGSVFHFNSEEGEPAQGPC